MDFFNSFGISILKKFLFEIYSSFSLVNPFNLLNKIILIF